MRPSPRFLATAVTLCLALTACQRGYDLPAVSRFMEPDLIVSHAEGPPNAAPGSCWGRDMTPAVVETVTEQVILQPAAIRSDGTVEAPPILRSETQQRIVRERREIWFETPCPNALTQEFTASVQRALAARGQYRGPETGQMDPRTRAAIRRFQSEQGLDSGVLSLAAARQLGLIAVRRE